MKQFLSITLFVFLASACKNKQETTQPLIENISESVYASGIVKSKNQYDVFSKVNGLVQEIIVKEGELVKAGTPIIQLSNKTSELNSTNAKLAAELANANSDKLNELKGNIELLKIKLKSDSLLFARQKSLWTQQVGTQNDLEQRELMYKNTLTSYNTALLNYNDVKKQLNTNAQLSNNNLLMSTTTQDDFTIKSEREGRLYKVLKEKGEMVTSLSPVAVIGSATDFLLELQVDENDIIKIKKGQKIVLSMNSYKNQVFEAKVEKINTIMNERSRSFTIEAIFVTKPPTLYPYLTTEANIIIQTKNNVLTIPRNYLIDDTYVLNKDKDKEKVKVGLKDFQKAEILEGITATDVITKPGK